MVDKKKPFWREGHDTNKKWFFFFEKILFVCVVALPSKRFFVTKTFLFWCIPSKIVFERLYLFKKWLTKKKNHFETKSIFSKKKNHFLFVSWPSLQKTFFFVNHFLKRYKLCVVALPSKRFFFFCQVPKTPGKPLEKVGKPSFSPLFPEKGQGRDTRKGYKITFEKPLLYSNKKRIR